MEKIVLQKTTNFALFEMHEMNRLTTNEDGFNPRKDLLESMKANGFRSTQPISCVRLPAGKLRIFDGHNRFVTARFLNIPVYYIAYSESHDITPLEYSRGQKTWSMIEKATAIALENSDYAEVLEFCKKTKIPAKAAFSMFIGESASSGNALVKVSSGTFAITDRNLPYEVAAITTELQKHCAFSNSPNFVYAICKTIFAKGFSIERMIEKISKHPELLKQCRSMDDYIDLLEFIYNRSVKNEKYYLKVEIEKAMKLRSFGHLNKKTAYSK